MEKKSTAGANSAAAAAVAATSTMMPSSGGSAPASAAAFASAARTPATSSSDADHRHQDGQPGVAARAHDRPELVGQRPGRAGAVRSAPPLRRGRRNGGILSPEKSSSRTTAGRPRAGRGWAPAGPGGSAWDGQAEAPVKAISVRSRPTPAAPPDRPSRVSAAEATLHSSVTSSPSAVLTSSGAGLVRRGAAACGSAAAQVDRGLRPGRRSARPRRRRGWPGARPGRPARRVGAGQHGQAQAARDDRRVRAGPAARPTPRRPARARPARMRSAGSTSRRTRMNAPAGGVGAGPAQVVEHRPGHLADVARPLGQVRVGQRGQHRGLGLGGRRDRGGASAPARTASSAGPTRAGSRRDQRGDVHDAGLQVLAARAQPGGQGGPVRAPPRRTRPARHPRVGRPRAAGVRAGAGSAR